MMFETLAEILVARGFKLEPHYSGDGEMLIASGPKYRVRAYGDNFQVGFHKTFDRWANSVDYESRIPQTEDALDRVLETVSTLKQCHYCPNWNTPHTLANRSVCPDCFQKRHKSKDPNGKRKR